MWEKHKQERTFMQNITELVAQRRSVRTYDGRPINEEIKERLLLYADGIQNPFHIPVHFKLLDAKKNGLVCPVVTGTDLYVGAKIENVPDANVAFGYSFEEFVLYAQSLGIGTVWLGGTMNRGAFEQAMELREDEMMPCATPLGYSAKKMSIRENMMRKAIKADERLPFEELFFAGSFDTPLEKEKAGELAVPLEMVRLAPSAVNKQPWRIVAADDMVHFYCKRNKGMASEGKMDIQMVDMGIALCHFALSAMERGMNIEFAQNNPGADAGGDVAYVASYRVISCPAKEQAVKNY